MITKDHEEVNEIEFVGFDDLKKNFQGDGAPIVIPQEGDKKPEPILGMPTNELDSSLKEEKETGEKPKEEKQESRSEKPAAVSSEASNQRREILKDLFGDKINKIVTEVNGEDVEVSIDEVEIDEEAFQLILKSGLQKEKEDVSKDKISVEGVSDYTKKLIEIEKNGGDIQDLVDIKKYYVDPLAKLDMETVDGQRQALYLLHKSQGLTDEVSERLIKSYEAESILDSESEKAAAELKDSADKYLEAKRVQVLKDIEDKKEKLKVFKKDLKENIASSFELNDTTKAKLVDLTTNVNKEGKYEIDNLYLSFRQDPKKSAKLALFLADMEEYDKQVSNKKLIEEKVKTGKLIKIAKDTETKSETQKAKEQGGSTVLFENLKFNQ